MYIEKQYFPSGLAHLILPIAAKVPTQKGVVEITFNLIYLLILIVLNIHHRPTQICS